VSSDVRRDVLRRSVSACLSGVFEPLALGTMIQTDAWFVLVVDQHESYVTHGLTDASYGDLRHTHALTNNRGHNGTRIIDFGIQAVPTTTTWST
jgi:hypothetical protein